MNTNPIISDFIDNHEINGLLTKITVEELAGYYPPNAIRLNNSYIIIDSLNITGKLLITTSNKRDQHMVLFETTEVELWESIEKHDLDKVTFFQETNSSLYQSHKSSFYRFPVIDRGDKKIDISVTKEESFQDKSIVRVFIKMKQL